MNSARITDDDTSRVSISIGIGLAVLLTVGVLYFIFIAHASVQETVGFDPNRPIPSDNVLRKRLKPEQYHVVRENGTETPFQNEYWDNQRTGIYADIITGEPLFSSLDKFETGTGQLAFTKPISKDLIAEKLDLSHDMRRTETRARRSDAHLGHLFNDARSPTGQRYSVNSAAFRFIPVERMAQAGYGKYLSYVGQKNVVDEKK